MWSNDGIGETSFRRCWIHHLKYPWVTLPTSLCFTSLVAFTVSRLKRYLRMKFLRLQVRLITLQAGTISGLSIQTSQELEKWREIRHFSLVYDQRSKNFISQNDVPKETDFKCEFPLWLTVANNFCDKNAEPLWNVMTSMRNGDQIQNCQVRRWKMATNWITLKGAN